MIKVAIYGAATKIAGELIRLLINHPDVELVSLFDIENKCKSIVSVHHGLIGEFDMIITDKISFDELDLLFICDKLDSQELKNILLSENIDIKIIDVSGKNRIEYEEFGMVYGLSEINRKPLVRGATKAVIPSSIASVVLISLYPLAINGLLNKNINVEIETPKNFADDGDYLKSVEIEIDKQLRAIQPNFLGNVVLSQSRNKSYFRGIRVAMNLDCELSIDDVVKIYDNIYDDHNLTFICPEPVDIKEVEGTDKCLISLLKNDNKGLNINSVADFYLRGGAGEAVHVMNLLCGLMERTGLMLKTITY